MELLAFDLRLTSMSYSVDEINKLHKKNIIFHELDARANSSTCGFVLASTEEESNIALDTFSDDE